MARVVALVVLLVFGQAGTAWADHTADQTVTVRVVDGDLLLSVERGPMALPTPAFSGAWYTTTGTLPRLTVVDTRAADPGWSLSGQFADESGGTPLSWTPTLVDQSAVQVLTMGKAIIGMRGSGLLAVADPAAGRGTAHLTAGYRLLLPKADGYTATLTLTVI
ncbi:hypothetical protein [Actinokineospora globicatena]|uniref:hypothetical protein n=1 Tax=Actinokineospora globicatena TaxID=103729 RepID=UPI0020A2CC0B|nr:hypothetical protein [Actinokineospora globicatena]GLW79934.1 hypothetical protein Aglo01_44150 [Actinokineospora globicatena]GLW86763.1 hypothetical protein Aglo02_44020 [Actinokineospora globicatena]